MEYQTPRTWPENCWPTADELADWLKICTDAERLHIARLSIDSSQRAQRCFELGHDHFDDPLPSARHNPKNTARPPHPDTMAGR